MCISIMKCSTFWSMATQHTKRAHNFALNDMNWTCRNHIGDLTPSCVTCARNHHSMNQFELDEILVDVNSSAELNSRFDCCPSLNIIHANAMPIHANCIARTRTRDSQIPFTCALAPIRSRTHLTTIDDWIMKRQNQLDLFASRQVLTN